MRTHLSDAWHTLRPRTDDPHGVLPPLLVAMTVVTGLVDAFSYLELARVLVANMTGNVVFLAFSLGGAPGFDPLASTLAIAAFLGGAFVGGALSRHHRVGTTRERHLAGAAAVQLSLVMVATTVTVVVHGPFEGAWLLVLVGLLGVAMGLQNATARSLAVPDLMTTVLTMTIAGLSSDSSRTGGKGSKAGRRVLSILAMFVGGVAGALACTSGHGPFALLGACALLALVALLARQASRV